MSVVEAVLFDLDDTLFPQSTWLDGAWERVADAAAGRGVDRDALHGALVKVAAEGSDRGRIIDRALELVGVDRALVPELVPGLVDAFRSHRPCRLRPWPGVRSGLSRLRARVPLGLVSDGDPAIQRSKLESLRLAGTFDVVLLSDELGRERRKPSAEPFLAALVQLGVDPAAAVYVGDRPDKDVAGAAAAGMRAVRVRTGEYASRPDVPPASATVADVREAFRLLEGQLGGVGVT